jgi:SAM-dependent methyltransferase
MQRRGMLARVSYAIHHPAKARRYLQRMRRDAVLRVRHRGDPVGYYRAVVADDLRHGLENAVGNSDRAEWRKIGQVQFDYLVQHGLQPDDHLLEIGCGNLRAGWRFINYLDPAHYFGVDSSADVILAAQDTLVERGLAGKVPHLTVVNDMEYAFLPEHHFDVVHAHSVFSHCPLSVIEDCFAHVGRLMKPEGIFDFTFYRTHGKEYVRLRENYYYRAETLIDAANRHGLNARVMDDWEGRHEQDKIRITVGVPV